MDTQTSLSDPVSADATIPDAVLDRPKRGEADRLTSSGLAGSGQSTGMARAID